MVFKQSLNIQTFCVGNYSLVELQFIALESDSTAVSCALIFRRPNIDRAFI